MRQIKFRVWDKEHKKMRDVYSINGTTEGSTFIEYYNEEEEVKSSIHENYELMQFTGLTDKNGKEIYEDDIIKIGWQETENVPNRLYKVIYLGECFARFNLADLETGGADSMIDFDGEEGEFEIIGNIYEHSELLTK